MCCSQQGSQSADASITWLLLVYWLYASSDAGHLGCVLYSMFKQVCACNLQYVSASWPCIQASRQHAHLISLT